MPQPEADARAFPEEGLMRRRFCSWAGAALLAAAAAQAAAQATGDYATDLAKLYSERHMIVALKDACSRVLPKIRMETQRAYEAWIDRHQDLLEDLEARFAALIKRASKDQKDYELNYGKYHETVIRQRDEQKQVFLAQPKEELLKQCRELPAYLLDPKSNIPARYPGEFKTVYKR
jgi:hypothetical protein